LDALTLHKDLDQLEWQVAANKEEVCDLKNMHVMAKNAKEKITEKIGFLEQDVHSQKAARDKELKNARKNAKIASHMPEVLFRFVNKYFLNAKVYNLQYTCIILYIIYILI